MSNLSKPKGHIVYNGVQCLMCGKTIESTYRHDYVVCGCYNSTMVDGGLDYVRFGGRDMSKVRLYTVTDDEPFEKVRKFAFIYNREKNPEQKQYVTRLYKVSDNRLREVINMYIEQGEKDTQWKTLLLIKEKQYRIENELYVEEEQAIAKNPEAIKERQWAPKEIEQEVIKFPVSKPIGGRASGG